MTVRRPASSSAMIIAVALSALVILASPSSSQTPDPDRSDQRPNRQNHQPNGERVYPRGPQECDGSSPATRALEETASISAAEACDRLDLQVRKVGLLRQARLDFPDTYAGSWIDHSVDGAINLAFTASAESSVEALNAYIPDGAEVVSHTVTYSEAELEKYMAEFFGSTVTPEANGGWYWSEADVRILGGRIDVSKNAIVIYVEAESEGRVRDVIASAMPYIEVEVKDEPAVDDACSRTNCDPPLRGGIRLERRNENIGFTLGFGARNAAGSRYMITHGHGGNVGGNVEVQHNDNPIGSIPTTGVSTFGPVDAARVFVNGNSIYSPGRTYYIYRTSSAQLLQVHFVSNVGDWSRGDVACMSGINAGWDCGVIQATNAPGASNTAQLEVSGIARGPGDSGAPYWIQNGGAEIALGVHNGGSGTTAYASHAENVENELDIFISTRTFN